MRLSEEKQDRRGSKDTALALDPTDHRTFYLARLKIDVDALSFNYEKLKASNDCWNQVIMVISSLGALITSILTIAKLVGWPFEIVPIVIQTAAGVIAAWMRFYDFPKRMEAVINIKHATNSVRERMQKSPIVDDNLWEQYCMSVKSLDEVLTPQERDKAHKWALKQMKDQRIRVAELEVLLNMSTEELLSKEGRKKLKAIEKLQSNGDSTSSSPSKKMLKSASVGLMLGDRQAQSAFHEMSSNSSNESNDSRGSKADTGGSKGGSTKQSATGDESGGDEILVVQHPAQRVRFDEDVREEGGGTSKLAPLTDNAPASDLSGSEKEEEGPLSI